MNKLHHPHNRAERLKLKTKANAQLVYKSKDRPSHAKKRVIEEVRAKELEDEARREVQGIES